MGNLMDRFMECFFVDSGGLLISADFAHKLEGGVLEFLVGGNLPPGLTKFPDVSAHVFLFARLNLSNLCVPSMEINW